jgi:hypothetical protein
MEVEQNFNGEELSSQFLGEMKERTEVKELISRCNSIRHC